MINLTRPIELKIRPAEGGEEAEISIFTSYSFDKNIMVPASAFRFTAEGVDHDLKMSIRSGSTVSLYARNDKGVGIKMATGFIDETDSHITPSSVGYVITGRDTISQLVDNSAIDKSNAMIFGGSDKYTIDQIAEKMMENTRMSPRVIARNVPNSRMLLQTNSGETKISVLQRYLEITNCLAWADPDGVMIVGKPNMSQEPIGRLWVAKSESGRALNNLLEARVKRAPAMAIRQISYQLQDLASVGIVSQTIANRDEDVRAIATSLAGRSVYRSYSIGNGTEAYDNLSAIGQGKGVIGMGTALALREMAMDNIKVLDVECVIKGHINDSGNPYDIDQVYEVIIDDEDLAKSMYVYAVRYDLTKERGPITTLRLCNIGALVYGVPAK
jgi:prophage tail gpP-like protein